MDLPEEVKTGEQRRHEVFISYAKDDADAATMVCNYLEDKGINCWLYIRDEPHGAKFEEAITDAINASKIMVLIYSSNSNASKYVQIEVKIAWNNGIPIIPFKLEDVPYSKYMAFYLQSHNWLMATVPPMEIHLQKLYDDVVQLMRDPRAPEIDHMRRFFQPQPNPVPWRKIVAAGGIFLLIMLAIAAIALFIISQPQVPPVEWHKIMGGVADDNINSIALAKDGGYLLAGYTTSYGNGSGDIYIVKTDADGNREWSRTLGGKGEEVAKALILDEEGNIVVGGATGTKDATSYDAYIAKMDNNCSLLWENTFGDATMDTAFAMQTTRDGGYILAGMIGGTGSNDVQVSDVYLVKTDSGGRPVWERAIGDAGMDSAMSVIQTKDGSFVAAGVTEPGLQDFARALDVYLVKVDENGKYLWKKNIGGNFMDMGNSIVQAKDGGYVIAGTTESYGHGGKDMYLVKTDENGNVAWSRTFGGARDDECETVAKTADGGYVLVGSTYVAEDSRHVYVVKTDSEGNLQWSKEIGYSDLDSGLAVRQTTDGGYIIGGITGSKDRTSFDMLLIKLAAPA